MESATAIRTAKKRQQQDPSSAMKDASGKYESIYQYESMHIISL